MSKYELVEFNNSNVFGLRVIGEDTFVDLHNPRHNWKPNSVHFGDCKGTKREAMDVLKIFENKPTIDYKVVRDKNKPREKVTTNNIWDD